MHKVKNLAVVLSLLFLVACEKEETTSANNNNGGSTTASFTWKENGGTTNTADSAFWTSNSAFTGIRAYKGGMANFFEMNWTGANNIAVGSKTISGSGSFDFIKSGAMYTGTGTNTLNLTAVSNNLLSGSFSATASNGSSTLTLTGDFANLGKR